MRRNIGSLLGRKGASLALAAAVAAAGLGAVVAPTRAMAKSDAAIAYIDETGARHELAAGSYTDISDSSFEDKEGYGLVDGWYVVRSSRDFDNRMTITGDAKLILCDGTTVNFEDGIRGYSGKLTIYAQSDGNGMGKLIATADGYVLRRVPRRHRRGKGLSRGGHAALRQEQDGSLQDNA